MLLPVNLAKCKTVFLERGEGFISGSREMSPCTKVLDSSEYQALCFFSFLGNWRYCQFNKNILKLDIHYMIRREPSDRMFNDAIMARSGRSLPHVQDSDMPRWHFTILSGSSWLAARIQQLQLHLSMKTCPRSGNQSKAELSQHRWLHNKCLTGQVLLLLNRHLY